MIIPILGKIRGSGDMAKNSMALIESMQTSKEEEAAKPKAKTDLLVAH